MSYFEKFVYTILFALAVVMWAYMMMAFVVSFIFPGS